MIPRELHALIAAMSRNAGLELFVDVFARVAQLYSPDWQRLGNTIGKETMRAHAKIAAAVMAGDGALARSRMRKHLEAEADFFRRRRSTRTLLPDSVVLLAQSGRPKGAETVARNLTQAIVIEGLQPGDLVGTEPELIEREGVSRALLREAVRLLEHHQIARMRRGPGGGLFVEAPSTPGGHRGGRDLSGPPGHAAARAGRAANRRRGRHRRPRPARGSTTRGWRSSKRL